MHNMSTPASPAYFDTFNYIWFLQTPTYDNGCKIDQNQAEASYIF
jgi:hypothetical protein